MDSFSSSRDEKDVLRHAHAMYLIRKVLFYGDDVQFQGTYQTKYEDMMSNEEEGMFLDKDEDMKQKQSTGNAKSNQSKNQANLVDAKGSLHQEGLHQGNLEPRASKGATSVSTEAASINKDAWAL